MTPDNRSVKVPAWVEEITPDSLMGTVMSNYQRDVDVLRWLLAEARWLAEEFYADAEQFRLNRIELPWESE